MPDGVRDHRLFAGEHEARLTRDPLHFGVIFLSQLESLIEKHEHISSPLFCTASRASVAYGPSRL